MVNAVYGKFNIICHSCHQGYYQMEVTINCTCLGGMGCDDCETIEYLCDSCGHSLQNGTKKNVEQKNTDAIWDAVQSIAKGR